MLGLIHVGPDVGFGVYGIMLPSLAQTTTRHLQQLPAAIKQQFPHAASVALAGRLPGLMTAAGEHTAADDGNLRSSGCIMHVVCSVCRCAGLLVCLLLQGA
jgi:hypothetical protein